MPTKPRAVEDLRGGDADAVGADRRPGPQREVVARRAARCRCTDVSVFMNTNSFGVQRRADAVGGVDDHRQPLHVGACLVVHQRHQRAEPRHGGLARVGGLRAPADASPDSRARPPSRGRGGTVRPRPAGDGGRWRRRRCREVASSHAVTPGDRRGRRRPAGATSRRTSARCARPVASTQARTFTGATGMAPRMSSVSRPMRSAGPGAANSSIGLGHQRQWW